MKYLKKYIRNFGFVNRVVWLTVKYNVLIYFLSNKQFIRKIDHTYIYSSKDFNNNGSQIDIKKTINRIDRVQSVIPFRKSCLIRQMTYYYFFQKININAKIEFGLVRTDDRLIAHCWNNYFPDERGTYIKVL